MAFVKSIQGHNLGQRENGALQGRNGNTITSAAVGCTITVAAESPTDNIDIAIQFTDTRGKAVDFVVNCELILFLTADMLAYVVTGGSTGIVADTNGIIAPIVAKKHFIATSEADGLLDVTWTDTATEAAYLGVKLPNGEVVVSDLIQCA